MNKVTKISVSQMLSKAKSFERIGNVKDARKIYLSILEVFPGNRRAIKALSELPKYKQVSSPSKDKLDSLMLLLSKGNLELVVKECKGLLEDFPESYMVWNILGAAFKQSGNLRRAEESFREASKLNPSNPDPHNNLGFVLSEQGKLKDAIESYREVLRISPDDFECHISLGNIFVESGSLNEALNCYKEALKINPQFSEAYNNQGNGFRCIGELKKSYIAYKKAIALDCNFPDPFFNISLLKLKWGDWSSGWKDYEHRFNVRGVISDVLVSEKPKWEKGFVGRLLIWAEQGVGDEVMFASCIDELRQYADRLIVSCDERLLPVFMRSFDQSISFVKKNPNIDEKFYDSQISIGSAFGYLRQTTKSFEERKRPYLKADDQRSNRLRSKLEAVANGKKIVGISWRSSAVKDGSRRSLHLPDLIEVIPNDFFLVNLQYGDVASDIEILEVETGRKVLNVDEVDNFEDLDGFCALIQACDLVISIDNSTVHFAGAMGTECHVLLPFSHTSDWRWGLHGTLDNHHYQRMRLYWQDKPNDWFSCLQSLQKKLGA